MSRFGRRLGALAVAAAMAAGMVAATPATAGAPHRVNDTIVDVFVDAVDDGPQVEMRLTNSDAAGTFAVARLYGPDGNFLADGYGAADWTETTFRAELDLLDDFGASVGHLTTSGTYALSSDTPERNTQKFNDGNIHVRMDHATTSLVVSDVTVSVDGGAWDVETAEGFHEIGRLFVSDPATVVRHENALTFGSSTSENMADFFLDGSLDDLGIGFDYGDAEAYASRGSIDLSKGDWDGTFRLFTGGDEEVGEVAASIALTPTGRTERVVDRVRGGYERWTLTPYEMVLTVDGPGAPARLTIELTAINHSIHTSPLKAHEH